MKRILLILQIVLCCIVTAEGQYIQIGPKAGVSLSHPSYSDKEYMSDKFFLPKVGYSAGMMMNFLHYKKLSVQTELNLTQRGRSIHNKEQQFKHTANYNFVEAPVLFKLTFGKDPVKYFVNAGPNISYWFRGRGKLFHEEMQEWNTDYYKYRTVFSDREPVDGIIEHYYENPNRFQFGIDVGIGTVFQTNRKERCSIELRYLIGHSFMAKTSSYNIGLSAIEDNLNFSTNALTLSVAYTFDINLLEYYKGKSTIKK